MSHPHPELSLPPALPPGALRVVPLGGIVASFASHVHRVQQVMDAAHAHGRRVALVGRSMVRNMGVAADLGYLSVPDGLLMDLKATGDLPDDEVVLT